mmetsp:Transcript_9222/g.21986  ORF Transcript_9222/g.21986 Transcript_9222/m.21986 type:complete len:356 (-) Transcript_9222:246-1313(-)
MIALILFLKSSRSTRWCSLFAIPLDLDFARLEFRAIQLVNGTLGLGTCQKLDSTPSLAFAIMFRNFHVFHLSNLFEKALQVLPTAVKVQVTDIDCRIGQSIIMIVLGFWSRCSFITFAVPLDLERTTLEVGRVHLIQSLLGISLVRKIDKTKSLGLAILGLRNFDILNASKLGKEIAQVSWTTVKVQIADIQRECVSTTASSFVIHIIVSVVPTTSPCLDNQGTALKFGTIKSTNGILGIPRMGKDQLAKSFGFTIWCRHDIRLVNVPRRLEFVLEVLPSTLPIQIAHIDNAVVHSAATIVIVGAFARWLLVGLDKNLAAIEHAFVQFANGSSGIPRILIGDNSTAFATACLAVF